MAIRELKETDRSCIKKFIIDFFRFDMNYQGRCYVKDFIVDEYHNEAYADIPAMGTWFSVYLKFEQGENLNIIPLDFIFNEYKGVV